MLDEQLVEDLAGRPARGRQTHDLRVVDGERLQLPDVGGLQLQLFSVPEQRVVREHPSQLHQKRALEVGRPAPNGDTLDAVALVEDLEEGPNVLGEPTHADVLGDLVEAGDQLEHGVGPARARVAVQHGRDLDEGDGADQVAPAHVLRPGDLVVHHPGAVHAQRMQLPDGRADLAPVAQGDVAAQLGLRQVELVEEVALHLVRGAEVDLDAQLGHGRFVGGHPTDRTGDALQPVDDVDGVLEVDEATPFEVVLATHAENDVRHTVTLEALDDLTDLGGAEDLTLVVIHLQQPEGAGVDDSAQNDVVAVLGEHAVVNLDAVRHLVASFQLRSGLPLRRDHSPIANELRF